MAKLQTAYEEGEDPLAELTELLDYDINAIAGLLKLYLRKLKEKIIPGKVHFDFSRYQIETGCSSPDWLLSSRSAIELASILRPSKTLSYNMKPNEENSIKTTCSI